MWVGCICCDPHFPIELNKWPANGLKLSELKWVSFFHNAAIITTGTTCKWYNTSAVNVAMCCRQNNASAPKTSANELQFEGKLYTKLVSIFWERNYGKTYEISSDKNCICRHIHWVCGNNCAHLEISETHNELSVDILIQHTSSPISDFVVQVVLSRQSADVRC